MSKKNKNNREPSSENGNDEGPNFEFTPTPPYVKITGVKWRFLVRFFRSVQFRYTVLGIIIGCILMGTHVYSCNNSVPANILVVPAVSTAISATSTAQPPNTPRPTPTTRAFLKVYDDSSSALILPEDEEYKITIGQRIKIQYEPGDDEKDYAWSSIPKEAKNNFIPRGSTHSTVDFIVPEAEGQTTVIFVCELNQYQRCPNDAKKAILIRSQPAKNE